MRLQGKAGGGEVWPTCAPHLEVAWSGERQSNQQLKNKSSLGHRVY